jgi:hypothetical protein
VNHIHQDVRLMIRSFTRTCYLEKENNGERKKRYSHLHEEQRKRRRLQNMMLKLVALGHGLGQDSIVKLNPIVLKMHQRSKIRLNNVI